MPLPAIGKMQGKAYLKGNTTVTRPLHAGEYVVNPDGTWSTEITTSVDGPNGTTAVIPTLWLLHGVPYRLTPQQAYQLAVKSKLAFPLFKTVPDAEAFTRKREAKEQTMHPSQWRPLWQYPAPAWMSPSGG